MSPLRFIGSLVAGRLSSRRICGQALGSARLLHQSVRHNYVWLPMGESHGSVVMTGALSLLAGGMWYFKEDTEEPAAHKLIHQEVRLEEDNFEERAMKKRFDEWMIKYGRRYRDEEEKAMRYEMFKSRAQRVDALNSRPGALCTFGTNKFADRTDDEFPC